MSETTEVALVPVEPPAIYAERRWHWIDISGRELVAMRWDCGQRIWHANHGKINPAAAALFGWKWWAPIEDAPSRPVKVAP